MFGNKLARRSGSNVVVGSLVAFAIGFFSSVSVFFSVVVFFLVVFLVVFVLSGYSRSISPWYSCAMTVAVASIQSMLIIYLFIFF